MKFGRNLYLTVALLAVMAATSAGNAWANTAAGVVLSNTATLSYNGTSISSSVNVTVALKQSAPNITISGGSGVYAGPNTPAILQTVTVIATANGPSTYKIATTTAAQVNTATGSVNIVNGYNAGSGTFFDQPLAASVTTGTSGATWVTVPPTTTAVDGSTINGFSAGTHIMVGSSGNHEVTVTGIVKQPDGTYQIQWSPAEAILDPNGPGQVVGEKKILNFYAYPGTVAAAPGLGTPITFDVTATSSNTVAGTTVTGTSASPATNTWTTTAPTLDFTKYVRNVSDSSIVGDAGTTATATFPGPITYTYYHSGVTAKPGQTLEYLIVAHNTDLTNPLTGCSISDLLPISSYAAFYSGAYGGASKDVFYFNNDVAQTPLQAFGAGPRQATLVGQTLTVKVGDGANDTTNGSIPATKNMKILYQLTIN